MSQSQAHADSEAKRTAACIPRDRLPSRAGPARGLLRQSKLGSCDNGPTGADQGRKNSRRHPARSSNQRVLEPGKCSLPLQSSGGSPRQPSGRSPNPQRNRRWQVVARSYSRLGRSKRITVKQALEVFGLKTNETALPLRAAAGAGRGKARCGAFIAGLRATRQDSLSAWRWKREAPLRKGVRAQARSTGSAHKAAE